MTKDERTATTLFSKAGVSLVTVLLFMLVATIAATATFKWLTSEGRSSGARMQKQAAYQSAMAGIENARAWMTYSANDVGALIKQFRDENKMIKLNNRLTPWLRANQDYDVWLAGVNTGTAHNFKLKILSSGKSAGGSVHNEVAIFNVDGLYQVQIPQEVVGINFDKAFDGRTTGVTGSDTMQSGIIHGDFTDQNNTPKLTGNFIISGDMGFGGHIHGDGDMYVKGSITSKNGGYTFGTRIGGGPGHLDTNVVYVGGDIACADNQPIRVYGDLYVGGSISQKCAIDVSGNLTIGGSIERTDNAAKTFTIGKNLVFKPDAEFHWTTTIGYGTGGQAGTGVGENTYLARLNGKNSNGDRKINFGKKIYLYQNVTGYENCPNKDSDGKFRPVTCTYCEGFFGHCEGSGDDKWSSTNERYFSFHNPLGPHPAGQTGFSSKVDAARILEWSKTDNVLGKANANYWKNIAKMNAYGNIIRNDGTIPQAILLKDSNLWMAKATENVSKCGLAANWIMNDDAVKKLNECYIAAKDGGWLYKGLLPIEWKYKENGVCNGEKLNGKFLIYASTSIGDSDLPPTTADAVVMFYFKRGVSGQLKGNHSGHRDWVYNYFMYSEADIKEIWNFNIKGSIIMAHGSTLKKYQGNNKLEFKSDVINFLASAGVIKENPEFTALAGGTDPSGGGGLEAAAGSSYDSYFIAAAPQLSITLESQYENNEPLPTEGDQQVLAPSFIVLPRVVYLPKDPYGTLADYINVVNLNGATFRKNMNNVSNCTRIPKTGLLYDRSAATPTVLPAGIHECTYSEGGVDIPFYVFVSNDEIGNKPLVSFKSGYQDMAADDEKYLELVCKAAPTGGMEFTVKVSKPNPADNTWQITKEAGAEVEGACGPAESFCNFKISSAAECTEANPKKLFKIKTSNATEGTYTFQMLDCVGCQISSPPSETFHLSSSVTITRHSLAEYCDQLKTDTGTECSDLLKAQANTTTWPDCNVDGIGTWVRAVGFNSDATNNCTSLADNDMWGCGATSDIKLVKIEGGIPSVCEAVIPEGETNVKRKDDMSTGGSYELYAALKAKNVSFHLGFAGSNYSGKTVIVSSNRFTSDRYCVASDDGCTYTDLFAGDEISLTVTGSNKEEFSYWKCNSGSTNCTADEIFSSATYTINALSGDNSITAWYGQKDKHCFFDEFKSSKACTNSADDGKYCFSYCNGSSCDIDNGATTWAKWVVLGSSTLRDQLQYHDGKIWLNRSYNRHKKQAEVDALKVLSTAQAGFYGSLKAQFQVPRLGRESDESSAKVNKSGFLLRSDKTASNYIMLNVFANREGKLAAKVCIGDACQSETLSSNVGGTVSVSSTDIVTMSAEIAKEGTRDILRVSVVKGSYGDYTTATARFDLSTIDGFLGLSSTVNEYVGLSLADPDFKVYDIGWKSDTYNAECWDTPPTVKCSFRAAYLGGIVPQNQPTIPWVGLSSWFDEKGCEPQYLYNGDDACGTSVSGGFKECYASDYYKFTSDGLHGSISVSGGDTTDTKMAKVKIKECHNTYLTQEERNLLYAEAARCGEFWVGAVNNCNQNVFFFPISSTSGVAQSSRTIATHVDPTPSEDDDEPPAEYDASELFSLPIDVVANLRSASVKVAMDNPNGSELEIYFRSETNTGYYGSPNVTYSASAVTTARTSATINVEELANKSGFDPEHVTGVIIRNHGTSSVTITEIKTICDNVASIQCKDAEYTGGRFRANTVVKHSEGAKSYEVSVLENGSSLGIDSTRCSNGVGCPTSDDYGRLALDSKPYNPYSTAFTGSKTYVLSVTMTDASGGVEGSPCTTPELVLYPLNGECKWASTNTKPSVQQGKGLPDFQYKLAECVGKCEWEVVLDGSTRLYQDSGAVPGFSSLSVDTRTGKNTTTAPLDVGDHKIKFRSLTESSSKFNECEMTFEVVDANSGTGNLTCTMPSQVLPGKAHSRMSVYSSLSNQRFSLRFDNGSAAYTEWINNGANNSWGDFTTPTVVGSHTYQITKAGGTEVECSGTFEVANGVTCEISDDQFVVSKASFVNSCYECTYSGVNCGNGGCTNVPHTYPFTMPTSGAKTLSISCKCDNVATTCSKNVVATVVAPTVSCPTNHVNVEPGVNISFTPTSLTGCEGDCSYWIESQPLKTTMKEGTITSASSISFASERDATSEKYTLNVHNSEGTAICTLYVDYQVPTYECPSDMNKATGSTVTVTPKNVTNCAQGCSYKVTKTSASGSEVIGPVTTYTYTSGALGNGFTGDTASTTVKYYVTLGNPAGNGTACDFNVTYKDVSQLCKCTDYCSEDQCASLVTSGSSIAYDGRCYFAKTLSVIHTGDGNTISINGVEVTGHKASGFPDKQDGGYYISTPTSGSVNSQTLTLGEPTCGTPEVEGVEMKSVYDKNSGKQLVEAGTTTIICAHGDCPPSHIACCYAAGESSCRTDQQPLTQLFVGTTAANPNPPTLDGRLASCTDGSSVTITNSEDLLCSVGCY